MTDEIVEKTLLKKVNDIISFLDPEMRKCKVCQRWFRMKSSQCYSCTFSIAIGSDLEKSEEKRRWKTFQ